MSASLFAEIMPEAAAEGVRIEDFHAYMCEFRSKPATDSEIIPATIPI